MQFLRFKPFMGPEEYEFKDPDTGYTFNSPTLTNIVQRIKAYRSQNELPELEYLEDIVENYTCSKPKNRAFCGETDLMKRRGIMGYLKGGIALVKNLMYKSFVSTEEADRRAEICLQCPHNVFPDKRGFLAWSDTMAEKMVGNRRSKYHDKLGNCEVCTCVLKGKVFYKGNLSFSKEELAAMEKVGCWQLELVTKK